jgi:hypothetical protein
MNSLSDNSLLGFPIFLSTKQFAFVGGFEYYFVIWNIVDIWACLSIPVP